MDFIYEHWRKTLEILILWIAIYQIYRLFKATRGARIITGLIVVLIAITLLSILLELAVLEWIITKAVVVLAFALLVIFQPELRSGLARLGSSKLFLIGSTEKQAFLDTLTDTIVQLSKKRFRCPFRHRAEYQARRTPPHRRHHR